MRLSIILFLCIILDGKPSEFRTIDVPAEEPSKSNIVYWDPMYNVTQQDWEDYKRKYGKVYSDPAEDKRHLEIYTQSKISVLQHNERYEKGLETFKVALYSDSDQLHCVQYINPKPSIDDLQEWNSEEFLEHIGTEKSKYYSELYRELYGPHEDRHREEHSIE